LEGTIQGEIMLTTKEELIAEKNLHERVKEEVQEEKISLELGIKEMKYKDFNTEQGRMTL
jgi:hypothetical protein